MINTNGFITEYTKAIQNKEWLNKEELRLNQELAIPNEKISVIMMEYGVRDLENKLKDVIASKRDNTNIINYYYFRSIIDGVYNLLKEYGWSYCVDTLIFLSQNFGWHYAMSDGFEIFYVDYITCLNPTCVLDLVRTHTQHYIKYEEDMYDYISIPADLDIMFVLTETENFLKDHIKLYKQKEKDEEFELYLRLKKKYEPIESEDGIN